MVPPRMMMATKKTLTCVAFLGLALLGVLLTGCKPAGVKALYAGEKHLRDGEFQQAVGVLEEAVSLMPTNALAYNFLGLAYHRNGQAREAHVAYSRALILDKELAVVRYNLGCLFLEQDNAESAINEFTSYTMRVPKSVPGWLKLGNAHLATEGKTAVPNAYRAFQTVLEIVPDHAEAFNGLGLMEMKRNRPQDALFYFGKALESKPDYAAVHLNIAIVAHKKLNDKSGALDSYKKYLSMEPRPENWDAVASVARRLEQELESGPLPQNPPPTVQETNETLIAEAPLVETNEVTEIVGLDDTNIAVSAYEQDTTIETGGTVGQMETLADGELGTELEGLETTVIPDKPLVRGGGGGARVAEAEPVVEPPAKVFELSPVAPETRRRVSYLERLEKRPGESEAARPPAMETEVRPATPVAPIAVVEEQPTVVEPPPSRPRTLTPTIEAQPRSTRRYIYLSPPRSAPGNRQAADRFFAEGLREQKAGRLPSAVMQYRRATQADPSYYEAFFNQGLAALKLRDWKQSLSAYEYALAQNPSAADARYNFALALEEGNYLEDAVVELNRILRANPSDVRAHLSVANVHSKMGQAEKAREHFQKVIQIQPNHPQVRSIKGWLGGQRGVISGR